MAELSTEGHPVFLCGWVLCEYLADKKGSRAVRSVPSPVRDRVRTLRPSSEVQQAEVDDELDPYGTLITPGLYDVGFRRAEKVKLFGRRVWLLDWTIVSPREGFGLAIRGFVSAVDKAQRLTPSLALVQFYAVATWRRPPRHLYRVSPAEFLSGALFEAAVRTVTRDRHGRDRPAVLHYSVVGTLVRRLSDPPAGKSGA